MMQYALEHPYLAAILVFCALLVTETVLVNLIKTIAAKRGDEDADSGTKSN